MMLQQLWPNQKIDFTEKKEKENLLYKMQRNNDAHSASLRCKIDNPEKREEYWEELIEINDMPSSSGAVLEIMNH